MFSDSQASILKLPLGPFYCELLAVTRSFVKGTTTIQKKAEQRGRGAQDLARTLGCAPRSLCLQGRPPAGSCVACRPCYASLVARTWCDWGAQGSVWSRSWQHPRALALASPSDVALHPEEQLLVGTRLGRPAGERRALSRTNVKQALTENTRTPTHTCTCTHGRRARTRTHTGTHVILQVDPISLAVSVALEEQQVGSWPGWAAFPLFIKKTLLANLGPRTGKDLGVPGQKWGYRLLLREAFQLTIKSKAPCRSLQSHRDWGWPCPALFPTLPTFTSPAHCPRPAQALAQLTPQSLCLQEAVP